MSAVSRSSLAARDEQLAHKLQKLLRQSDNAVVAVPDRGFFHRLLPEVSDVCGGVSDGGKYLLFSGVLEKDRAAIFTRQLGRIAGR